MTFQPPPSQPRKRIFFLDPSLGAMSGHHRVIAENYAAMLGSSGHIPIFVGNRTSAHAAPLPQFEGWFPYLVEDAFRVARYGKGWAANSIAVSAVRAARRVIKTNGAQSSDASNPMTRDACSAVMSRLGAVGVLDRLVARFALTSTDHVVALSVDPALIAALHERAPAWLGPAAPTLHLVFMYPEATSFGGAMRDGLLAIYRDVVNIAASCYLYAETRAHALWLTERLNKTVHPIVSPTRLLAASPPAHSAEPVASVLGAARADKGFPMLPAIAERVSALAPSVRFRLQRPARSDLAQTERLLRRLPNATLLPAELSDRSYNDELTKSHIVLLPYDATAFSQRGSGVLVDALIAGRPIVCTRGSALEEMVREGNGVAAGTIEEFAEAIAEIVRDYPRFINASGATSARTLAALKTSPMLKALTAI